MIYSFLIFISIHTAVTHYRILAGPDSLVAAQARLAHSARAAAGDSRRGFRRRQGLAAAVCSDKWLQPNNALSRPLPQTGAGHGHHDSFIPLHNSSRCHSQTPHARLLPHQQRDLPTSFFLSNRLKRATHPPILLPVSRFLPFLLPGHQHPFTRPSLLSPFVSNSSHRNQPPPFLCSSHQLLPRDPNPRSLQASFSDVTQTPVQATARRLLSTISTSLNLSRGLGRC